MVDLFIDDIKKIRELTGAGVLECRKALAGAGGDIEKAIAELKKRGMEVAKKKQKRATKQGYIEIYSHNDGKLVAVVELLCETDFVARNQDFRNLAHELALQVAAMNPKNSNELLTQPSIRDASQTVDSMVKLMVARIRENIQVGRIARFELGE